MPLRYGGAVEPTFVARSPLALRLPQEVYSRDGIGCYSGPAEGPEGRGHVHHVACGSDYIVAPGARIGVGPGGHLYESMGGFPGGKKGMLIAGAVGLTVAWFFFLRKKRR